MGWPSATDEAADPTCPTAQPPRHARPLASVARRRPPAVQLGPRPHLGAHVLAALDPLEVLLLVDGVQQALGVLQAQLGHELFRLGKVAVWYRRGEARRHAPPLLAL